MIMAELFDASGMPIANGAGPQNPLLLNAIAPTAGTYYVHLINPSGRPGYAVSVDIVPGPLYPLSVSSAAGSNGNGRIVSEPAGLDANIVSSGSGTTVSFLEGKTVTLIATPAADSVFTGWGGPCTGTEPICMVTMDEAKDVTVSFTAIPVSSVILIPNTASPATLGTGGVTFTAQASGGSGNYEYQFRYKEKTGAWITTQTYSQANTWIWTPDKIGSYYVVVMVRNAGRTTAGYDAYQMISYSVVADPVSSVSLSADKTSPGFLSSIGTVTFTAVANGGSGTYEYQFRVKDDATGIWSTVQSYSTGNTWVWTPTTVGDFTIQVMARNAGVTSGYDVYKSMTFSITPDPITAEPVSSVTLTSSKPSPTISGSGIVTFTAQASGGSGNYEYQFRIKDNATGTWTTVQNFSSNNTWDWTPATIGDYTIQLMARNAGGTGYDAYKTMAFSVIAAPASSVTLTSSKPTPMVSGSGTVTFTAQANGGSGNYEYQFRVKDNATGTWATVQSFSGDNTWDWTPTTMGGYTIQLMARNAGRTGYDAYKTMTVSVVAAPVSSVTVTSSRPSPVSAGSGIVTFSALASGGSGIYEYQFRVKDPSGVWTTTKVFSAANTWDWMPTAAGSYTIQVMARNAGRTGYDVYRNMAFTIN